jgi:hypothetical protein
MKTFAAILLACLLSACSAPAQTLDEAVALFRQDRGTDAAAAFEALIRANPRDPAPRAWLAEVHARESGYEAARQLARGVLAEHPCHAQAHNALAQAFPTVEPADLDSAWAHAGRAVECAPDDGTAWMTYWERALLHADTVAEQRAARRIGELGFFTGPAMEMGRWILRSAPPSAVLIAGGEWDYHPMRVAQATEGLRPDVTVLNVMMMPWPIYVRTSAVRSGYPLPPQAAELPDYGYVMGDDGPLLPAQTGALWTSEWFAGRNPRPLALTFTVVDASMVRRGNRLRDEGPVISIHRLPPDGSAPQDDLDPAAFTAAFADLDLARLDGPQAHPSDRDPFRNSMLHPAARVGYLAMTFAAARGYGGDRAGAEQGFRWAETLQDTGHTDADYKEALKNSRINVETMLGGRP